MNKSFILSLLIIASFFYCINCTANICKKAWVAYHFDEKDKKWLTYDDWSTKARRFLKTDNNPNVNVNHNSHNCSKCNSTN